MKPRRRDDSHSSQAHLPSP